MSYGFSMETQDNHFLVSQKHGPTHGHSEPLKDSADQGQTTADRPGRKGVVALPSQEQGGVEAKSR